MRAIDWFKGRTRREQVLLSLMGALIFGLCVWFGVVTPLNAWGTAAEKRYDQAAATTAAVGRDLIRISALEKAPTQRPRAAGSVEQTARDLAAADGLEIARAETIDGALVIWTENAPPTAVFGWIAALHRQGVVVSRATVLKGADGGLDVEIALDARA